MRTFKLIFLGALMIVIILLALANRAVVTLNVLPEQLHSILPVSVDLPLFVVILLSILTGLLIGYVLEWLREHKHRRFAAEKGRQVGKLEREVQVLKKQTMSEEDEVLALLR